MTSYDLSSTSTWVVRRIRNNAVLSSVLHLFENLLPRYPDCAHTQHRIQLVPELWPANHPACQRLSWKKRGGGGEWWPGFMCTSPSDVPCPKVCSLTAVSCDSLSGTMYCYHVLCIYRPSYGLVHQRYIADCHKQQKGWSLKYVVCFLLAPFEQKPSYSDGHDYPGTDTGIGGNLQDFRCVTSQGNLIRNIIKKMCKKWNTASPLETSPFGRDQPGLPPQSMPGVSLLWPPELCSQDPKGR